MNSSNKSSFRKTVLEELKKLKREYLNSSSKKAFEILSSSKIFQDAKEVLLYFPFSKSELDLFSGTQQFKSKKFYLPKVLKNQAGEITCAFNKLESEQRSVTVGKYQNLALENSIDLFDFSIFELILVPGLAFDKKGYRLGRGLGYYDRLISLVLETQTKTSLIGVCFENFLLEEFDFRESHDQRVNLILTERALYKIAH